MIREGGEVIAAKCLRQTKPVYPPMAILARVQGTVVLQAIIGRDGTVQDLKVVSGPALLIRAAMEAVKTWRYQPTLLNGEPVDVLTEISVNFTLTD
jgi:protein TonB